MSLINETKKKKNVDQFPQVNDITDGDHGSLPYIVTFKEHDFGETVSLLQLKVKSPKITFQCNIRKKLNLFPLGCIHGNIPGQQRPLFLA